MPLDDSDFTILHPQPNSREGCFAFPTFTETHTPFGCSYHKSFSEAVKTLATLKREAFLNHLFEQISKRVECPLRLV